MFCTLLGNDLCKCFTNFLRDCSFEIREGENFVERVINFSHRFGVALKFIKHVVGGGGREATNVLTQYFKDFSAKYSVNSDTVYKVKSVHIYILHA